MVSHDQQVALNLISKASHDRAPKPPSFGSRICISASISPQAKAGLRQRAKELGYLFNGKGNINMLLEAIGTGTLRVEIPDGI